MKPYDWETERAFGPMPREFPPVAGPGRGYVIGEQGFTFLRRSRWVDMDFEIIDPRGPFHLWTDQEIAEGMQRLQDDIETMPDSSPEDEGNSGE